MGQSGKALLAAYQCKRKLIKTERSVSFYLNFGVVYTILKDVLCEIFMKRERIIHGYHL